MEFPAMKGRIGFLNLEIFALLISVNVWLGLRYLSDYALIWSYTFHNVPYGIVWAWLNPFYWTQDYKIYVLAVQLPVTILQIWLVKKGRLNMRMLQLFLLTTAMYRLMTVSQEVIPTMFLTFSTINPLFSLGFLAQKIPFWSLSFSDPHYQCAIGNCVFVTLGSAGGIQRALFPYTPDVMVHWTFIYWLVLPIYAWFKKRKDAAWNETRFWNRWAFPLMLLLFGAAFILYAFGCCTGWAWAPGYGPGTTGLPK